MLHLICCILFLTMFLYLKIQRLEACFSSLSAFCIQISMWDWMARIYPKMARYTIVMANLSYIYWQWQEYMQTCLVYYSYVSSFCLWAISLYLQYPEQQYNYAKRPGILLLWPIYLCRSIIYWEWLEYIQTCLVYYNSGSSISL